MFFSKLVQYFTDSTITVVYNHLKLLKKKVPFYEVRNTLVSHPDYPSILAIMDTYREFGLSSEALEIDINELEVMPLPFIASTKNEEFILIKDRDETSLTVSNGKDDLRTITKNEFNIIWDRRVIYAEQNQNHFSYKENTSQQRKNIKWLLIMVILLYSFYILIPYNFEAFSFFYFILKLVGFTLSIFLILYEHNLQKDFVDKVCKNIKKGNCNAILKSEGARFFNLFSWVDLGFVYFSLGILILLIPFFYQQLSFFLILLSIASVLFIPYSIYYQKVIAKQWCLLCLCIQGILFFETVLILFNYNKLILSGVDFTPNMLIHLIFLTVVAIIILSIFRLFLSKIQEVKSIKRELFPIKYNDQVFSLFLNKSSQLNVEEMNEIGILIGDENAKNSITKVCNPYCEPCAKVHLELRSILKMKDKFKLYIIFYVPEDESDFRTYAALWLITLAEYYNSKDSFDEILDGWYESKNNNFFKGFSNRIEISEQSKIKLKRMNQWCVQNDIEYTPTVFINGMKFPAEYSIKDIPYFFGDNS